MGLKTSCLFFCASCYLDAWIVKNSRLGRDPRREPVHDFALLNLESAGGDSIWRKNLLKHVKPQRK